MPPKKAPSAPVKQEKPAAKKEAPKAAPAQKSVAKKPAEKPKQPEKPKAPAAKQVAKAVAPPVKPKGPDVKAVGIHVKPWCNEGADSARALFQSCGKIVDIRLRRNKFCMVWFDAPVAAKKAVETYHQKTVKGHAFTVTLAKKSQPVQKKEGATTVFVSPLFKQSTTRKQILDLFRPYGKILKLRFYKLNYAFVYFDNAASAQKAVKEKNGAVYHNKKLMVRPSVRTIEKEKKRARIKRKIIEVRRWRRQQKRRLRHAKKHAPVRK